MTAFNLQSLCAARPDAVRIDNLDWEYIAEQLDKEGYALLPGLLDRGGLTCRAAATEASFRPAPAYSISGHGERFYFDAGLPHPWSVWRAEFYRHLAVIANHWNKTLGVDDRYPDDLGEFLLRNRQAGQVRPQSHISRLTVGDYEVLHQHEGGRYVFPLQVVMLISEPGQDFLGGELVMTERRPRMQSRPMVLPLRFGDAAIIGATERPCRGAQGHYRLTLKHAISRVRQGERIGVELLFHDAP